MEIMSGIMIQTAVLVTAILAVRRLFGEKLHAYIRYGLWLLVVLRLLMPVNFIDSPVSLLRAVNAVAGKYMEASPSKGNPDSYRGSDAYDLMAAQGQSAEELLGREDQGEGIELQTAGENITAGDMHPAMGENVAAGDLQAAGSGKITEEDAQAVLEGKNTAVGERPAAAVIFRWLWIVGSLLVGGTLFTAHVRFRRRLRRTRQLYQDGRVRSESNTRKSRKPYRNLPVYQADQLEAPCLVGVLNPAVYIGMDMQAGTDRFRYVVTHEQVHYLHGDHIWALLRAVLVTVYWFHPFVWIAASASARDGEIACDHGTIRRLGDNERLTYGEMLLDLSRKNHSKRVYSYGTMLRPGNSELKERITRLVGGGARLSAGILTVVLMLAMAGCAFTGASRKDGNMETAGMDGTDEMAADNGFPTPADSESDNAGTDVDLSKGSNAGQDGLSGESISGSERETENAAAKDSAPENTASGEGDFDPEEEITGTRRLTAKEAVISAETELGVDGPTLDYAGQLGWNGTNGNGIIFHDYFGLIVYDLTNGKIVRSLDLAAIGCQFTQGDNVCQVAVSADGADIWLHPRAKRYMFHYEADQDLLWQVPLVKSFEVDLETEDLFDRYLVTEEQHIGWRSNYLYEEYKDESGLQNAYIYLYASPSEGEPWRMRNLQCVWDDMVFILWDENSASTGQAASAGGFPYRYDGVVNEVLIQYDEPCKYLNISDPFGERSHPVSGEVRVHEGIDYRAEEGTDITAAADGTVYETGFSAEYGNYVVLLHQNGDMTYYCCCQDITVSQEEQVKRGAKIATVGSTGRSTGAHLHFALSRDGEFVDPTENMD